MFGGLLTLFLALVISGVAAYFSVVGLAAIFAATYWAVIVMGVSLEAGKLVAAGWLHANWHNPVVNKLHKSYMTMAVVVLMIITALGIYGFLSKGHLEQQASGAPVALAIAQKEARIEQLNTQIAGFNARQAQLDTAVNSIIADNATGGLRARRQQTSERAEITRGVEAANAEINTITTELVPLKLEVAGVEAKLGPIKYLADAFGWKDPEAAVRLVILLLMFAFDPLAVVLVISAIITISSAIEDRRKKVVTAPLVEGALLVEDEDEDEEASAEEIDIVVDETLEEKKAKAEAAYLAVLSEEATQEPETVTEHVQAYVLARKAHEEMLNANEPDTDGNMLLELEEQIAPKDDETVLLDILERRPELLQNVIDAVTDESNANSATSEERVQSSDWLDESLHLPPR